MVDKKIEIRNVTDEMKASYLSYAMSVIVSRALPDARDGLKPVHRRIIFAMYKGGYDWSKQFRKSARVVGDVIGKYHPHGDQAVYDALVRLAQDFSMSLTLLDGQGNFGSLDGDRAAAMRYTETRLAKVAEFLISDIDKIPKLDNLDIRSINNKLFFFKQKMFYYKFNLCSKSISWFGTRACRRRNLSSPQWLRNIKSKNYPFWRVDTFFSKNKYTNLEIIDDGGWHFSYLNTPEEIENKLKNYAHYREYELNSLGISNIKKRVTDKISVYNLNTDMKESKFLSGQKLEKVSSNILPDYLREHKEKYIDWLE